MVVGRVISVAGSACISQHQGQLESAEENSRRRDNVRAPTDSANYCCLHPQGTQHTHILTATAITAVTTFPTRPTPGPSSSPVTEVVKGTNYWSDAQLLLKNLH
jgi:hypothetical protein